AEAENGGFASTASRLVLMRWGLSGSRARGRVRSTLAASYFCFESARAARFGKHASQLVFHEANLRQSTDTAPASTRIEVRKGPNMPGDVTILHNPRCSTSRFAVQAAKDAGAEAQVRNYLNNPLTEARSLELPATPQAEPTVLEPRDENFKRSGRGDGNVSTAEQVAKVLAETPLLAQRPVLIRGGRAIIGRPKSAVVPFLA